MRPKRLPTSRPSLALAALLLCASWAGARAQGQEAEAAPAARTAAEKLDEFGDLRHCDLTARLDNLAIELQNEGSAKGYIVGYSPPAGRAVDGRLKTWRHYLINTRGIAAERVFFYNAGVKEDAKDFTAELWVVPEGALPPVPHSALEEARKDFSGRLDTYPTSESVYREESEMGPSYEEVAMTDFAEKLRAQPEYKGYLVIRAAKDSLPGSYERLERRVKRRLEKEFEVGGDRLAAIDAGYTNDEEASVELWILPKDGPPPAAAAAQKPERKMTEAFRLNALEYYDEPDEDEADWVIENLAEALRRDPKAQACIIVRAHPPQEQEAEGGVSEGDEGAQGEEVSAAVEPAPAEAAPESAEAAAKEPERKAADARGVAEKWKLRLVEKYGVESHRLLVMLGWPAPFSHARLEIWVAPPKAMLPDPLVVTKDEEPEEVYEDAGEGTADAGEAAPQPPPL